MIPVIPVLKIKGDILKFIVQWLEARKGKGHFVQRQQILRTLAQGSATYADYTSGLGHAGLLKTLMDIETAADYLDVRGTFVDLDFIKKKIFWNTYEFVIY